ncbi:ABC transporter permease [Pseudonocardia nigra]|uniref:ABC transporter permease n=1 Tax=Pseudonocardia nigra TaxID=1921578 RepID=UPI001C5EB1E4|nr:ABC transporter permease [Pseudonocardia nigra]
MSHSIVSWLARRLLGALLTLVIASVVVYAALRLVPGDPAATLAAGRRLTPEQLAALRETHGLDESFVAGYLGWVADVLRLDLGTSSVYQDAVTALLASRLPVSAFLIGYSAVLTVVLGLSVAVVGAVRGGVVARMATVLTSGAAATPPFVAVVVLLTVFAVQLGWFPVAGAGEGFLDRLWHLTLPALAMALAAFGVLARVAQATFMEQLRREHVEVARSRGVGQGTIVRRHVVRNSLGPILTLVGLLIAGLFVGTAVVETAFGLNGIGSFLVASVARQDFPVVQAISLIAVALFVVVSTVVDLLLPVVDPRVRKELFR